MKIKAVKRETGKKAAKLVRSENKIPSVLYGGGMESVPLEIDYKDFYHYYKESLGHQNFVFLQIGKKEYRCLVRDMQIDPVTRAIVHLDFQEITAGHSLDVEIPVVTIGDAPGIKEGGMLDAGIRDLQIRCMPKDLPDVIEIDVSELQIGDSIHIEDVQEKYPDIEFLQPSNTTLVSILAPKMEVEEAEEELEGEEGAEEKSDEAAEKESTE